MLDYVVFTSNASWISRFKISYAFAGDSSPARNSPCLPSGRDIPRVELYKTPLSVSSLQSKMPWSLEKHFSVVGYSGNLTSVMMTSAALDTLLSFAVSVMVPLIIPLICFLVNAIIPRFPSKPDFGLKFLDNLKSSKSVLLKEKSSIW